MKRARPCKLASTALIAAGMSLAGLAAAQDTADETVEEPRHYKVEVIVFKYEQQVSVGSEVFLPDPPPAPEPLPDELDAPADDAARGSFAEAAAEPPLPEGSASDGDAADSDAEFLVVPADALAMTDIASKLERLDVYRPLLHAAWTQAALPRESSITIELDMLAEPPANLDGRFTLYLSRFLHLDVDLVLEEDNGNPVIFDVPEQLGYAETVSGLLPVRYRIREDRIFKNGDTRYFDHPRFGLVARISRVEEAEDESDVDPIADLTDTLQ